VAHQPSQKPTLLVSCTDRKTLPAPKALQLRGIAKRNSVLEACEIWADSVSSVIETGTTLRLRDLYGGEYWKLALAASEEANLLIASAGLGLVGPDSKGPGYGATFVAGSPDSVLRFDQHEQKSSVRSEWWDGLASNGLGTKSWIKKTSDVVLVAISSSYQEALSGDLEKLADAGRQVIVMSGSPQIPQLRDIENIHHVETGQWLRMILGGSTPCVGIRFAAHLLNEDKWRSITEIESELNRMERQYLNGRGDKLPVFNRTTQTDIQVTNWIKQMIKSCNKQNMKPSKSLFLREYRNSGFACEQKRFGALFEAVFER
jgi:hypothetical protein